MPTAGSPMRITYTGGSASLSSPALFKWPSAAEFHLFYRAFANPARSGRITCIPTPPDFTTIPETELAGPTAIITFQTSPVPSVAGHPDPIEIQKKSVGALIGLAGRKKSKLIPLMFHDRKTKFKMIGVEDPQDLIVLAEGGQGRRIPLPPCDAVDIFATRIRGGYQITATPLGRPT